MKEIRLRSFFKAKECVLKVEIIKNTTLKFNVFEYAKLIDYNSNKITPLPRIQNITNNDIKLYIQSHAAPKWKVTNFLCRIQSVNNA